MATLQSIIARWDAAIASTRDGFEQVLHEAWYATSPLVADTRLDLAPLVRAWGAVEHQLHLHGTRVADAWEATCDALSELDDVPEDLTWREGQKRDVATRELALRHQQFSRMMMAQAAEHMRRFAVLQDAGSHHCPRCTAVLGRGTALAQAHDVTCAGCGATVTIEPGDAWRVFAASGARLLAEAAALGEYEAMVRAELRIDGFRERKQVPVEFLGDVELTARRYWTVVFETEAKYVPELAGYVAAKIERHLHDVRRKLSAYWQWRQRAGAQAGSAQ